MDGANSCCFFGLAACREQVLQGIYTLFLSDNIRFSHFTRFFCLKTARGSWENVLDCMGDGGAPQGRCAVGPASQWD